MPNPILMRRVLKPPGGISMNPVVSSWATRVVANGGAAPSAATKTAINTFYNGLVTDGIDGLIITMNVFAPDNLTAAITPLVVGPGSDPWTNHGFVAGDLSTAGLVCANNAKYLDLNVTGTTAWSTDNDYGMSVYGLGAGSNSPTYRCGLQGTTSTGLYYDGSEICWGIFGFQEWSVAQTMTVGRFHYETITRTGATAAAAYHANGLEPWSTVGTTNVAPVARTNLHFFLNARNMNGTANLISNDTYSFFCVHHGMTSAQAQKMFNRVQTLRTTLGGGYT